MIRQGVMCRADIQVLTYKWVPDGLMPAANKSSPHKCVDWDKLFQWAKENAVDVFKPGLLVHPTKG